MLDAGLIEEIDDRGSSAGAPRRCYRMTRYGREVAQLEAQRLDARRRWPATSGCCRGPARHDAIPASLPLSRLAIARLAPAAS